MLRLDIGLEGQRAVAGCYQNLFIAKHFLKLQPWFEHRIVGLQINFKAQQGADASKLKFLAHVHIHIWQLLQVGPHHLEQSLVARVTLHANAQRAAFTMCKLGQAFFGQLQLRQYPLGVSPQRVFTFPKPVAPVRCGMCMRPSPSLAASCRNWSACPTGVCISGWQGVLDAGSERGGDNSGKAVPSVLGVMGSMRIVWCIQKVGICAA